MSDDNVVDLPLPEDASIAMPNQEVLKIREQEEVICITFCVGNGEQVGQFWYNAEAHEFEFEGATSVSARVFVDTALQYFKEQLDRMYASG